MADYTDRARPEAYSFALTPRLLILIELGAYSHVCVFRLFVLCCVLTNVYGLGELPQWFGALRSKCGCRQSCRRIGQKMRLQWIYLDFLQLQQELFTFNCTLPLLVQTVPATSEVFVTWWKERFSSPLTPVPCVISHRVTAVSPWQLSLNLWLQRYFFSDGQR